MRNTIRLDANIAEVLPLRFTPSGTAVLDLFLEYSSWQDEDGLAKKITIRIAAKIIGQQAEEWQNQQGKAVKILGFLGQKSIKSLNLVLHIQKIELNKG